MLRSAWALQADSASHSTNKPLYQDDVCFTCELRILQTKAFEHKKELEEAGAVLQRLKLFLWDARGKFLSWDLTWNFHLSIAALPFRSLHVWCEIGQHGEYLWLLILAMNCAVRHLHHQSACGAHNTCPNTTDKVTCKLKATIWVSMGFVYCLSVCQSKLLVACWSKPLPKAFFVWEDILQQWAVRVELQNTQSVCINLNTDFPNMGKSPWVEGFTVIFKQLLRDGVQEAHS